MNALLFITQAIAAWVLIQYALLWGFALIVTGIHAAWITLTG